MQTLTYGYKRPDSGDKGTTLFTALADNITRVDGHSHNGVDSPFLTAQAITGVPQTIAAGSWVSNGPTGFYRQLVTLPAGFDFDTVQISFRTSGGEYVFPQVERVSTTQYYIYTIDNSVAFVAVYGG